MISIYLFTGMDQFDRDSTIADFKNGTIKLMVRCLQCVVFVHISLLYVINFLLTEREVCSLHREISDRGLFCTDRTRSARTVQKNRGTIFLCTDRASEVNKKFILSHFLFLPGCFEALELRSLDFRQSH